MTTKRKAKLIAEARELGVSEITIDGVLYKLGHQPKPIIELDEKEIKALIKPISILDGLSDDEILYFHSPYFDELQEQKKLREEQLKNKEDLNGQNS